jgi:RNA polymerase sigma-70 factor (ECF subfamily)
MTTTPAVPEDDFHARLRAARAGDERAWRALYRWLAPQVHGFLRATRAPDADDVLGEVFLEVARRIGGFRGDSRGFRAWVFTIARARRVDEIRRQARRQEDPLDGVPHQHLASRADVEAEALAMVGLADLVDLLDELTDDQSEVLVLRAIGGWTSREVAEITGRSIGSVEQLQHRAKKSLRDLLDERKEMRPPDDSDT